MQRQKIYEALIDFLLNERCDAQCVVSQRGTGCAIDEMKLQYLNDPRLHAEITSKASRILRIVDDAMVEQDSFDCGYERAIEDALIKISALRKNWSGDVGKGALTNAENDVRRLLNT